MEQFFDLLRKALLSEANTTLGRINLVFGVIAVGMVILLQADSAVEKIGDFILRLFGRQPAPPSSTDKPLAIVSVLVFFCISLVLVAF